MVEVGLLRANGKTVNAKMPIEHLQKSKAFKKSRLNKHAAVLRDLWSSSDEEETSRPSDSCILVPDTPSPSRERKLHPIVEHPLPRSSGRKATCTCDIGESILHQLKTERKKSSQDNIKDSTKELKLPQETDESTLLQTTRELSKPTHKRLRLSRPKPPKDRVQTSMKSFVSNMDETASHSERVRSKNSGRKNHNKNLDSSQEEDVIDVKKSRNSALIHRRNQYREEGVINSGRGVTTESFIREQNDPARLHSNKEIRRSHQVESVISNKNTSRNKHHDEWFRPNSEAFSNSESRANIGRQPMSSSNSLPEFGGFDGLDIAEFDSCGSSSDSDSILSPTFSKRSSPCYKLPLVKRVQNNLGAGPRRQNDVEKRFSQPPELVKTLSRGEEKVTSQKHNGFLNVLPKMSTAQKDSNIGQRFGQNKRTLKVDNPQRTKKAKIYPVTWSMSNILNSSSNALERRTTTCKLQGGSVGSEKQLHNRPTDKDCQGDNGLDTSEQKIMELFGRTSSDDGGEETEEDEDKIQSRQDDQVILIDSGRDAAEETKETKSTMVPTADPDSKHMSMSLRASCSQGPSEDESCKRVAIPPQRDEAVILIDITQSADRGAMSGQASTEFQSNFSPCQRNLKSLGSSSMNFKQKAPLNEKDPVSAIKLRSNVAWDDDVVHINTAQNTESDDSSEPRSPTFSLSHNILASGRSPTPSLSPVFSRQVSWEITAKKSNSTSSNNPAPQNLTSFGSPGRSLSPVFLRRIPREITAKTNDSTSINNPAPQHLMNHKRKIKNARRNLPDEHGMIVNLTGTDHPDGSGHTSKAFNQRWTDANSSLMLAGQVSSSGLGKTARGPKSDVEEVRSRPSPGRTDGVTVSSSSYPIGFNSRLEPNIQDITHATPRLLDTTSGSLSYVTSSNQDVNKPNSITATRNFELEVGELGVHQTSNSSRIRSKHIAERHLELPGVDPDDRSGVSEHKSRRPRREARKNKDSAGPPAPDVTEISSMNAEGHRLRHRKEHKSSKHGKRRSRERRFSGRPASPDVIEMVRQMENDEAMAKQLQEEFDAEANRLAVASSNDQPILIHDVDGPGSVPIMPELPSLFPGAPNPACSNPRGTNLWEMQWRDDLADNNPVNAAMMLEMDRFLVDNMEGHIGPHTHLPLPRQRHRGQRRGRGRGRRNNHHLQSPTANGTDYETLWNLAESVGSAVSKGLPESSINYLPTFLYTPGQALEEKECSICMGDYETGENMRRLPCFHFYHAVCIDKWLKENRICPVCREEVNFNPVNFH